MVTLIFLSASFFIATYFFQAEDLLETLGASIIICNACYVRFTLSRCRLAEDVLVIVRSLFLTHSLQAWTGPWGFIPLFGFHLMITRVFEVYNFLDGDMFLFCILTVLRKVLPPSPHLNQSRSFIQLWEIQAEPRRSAFSPGRLARGYGRCSSSQQSFRSHSVSEFQGTSERVGGDLHLARTWSRLRENTAEATLERHSPIPQVRNRELMPSIFLLVTL